MRGGALDVVLTFDIPHSAFDISSSSFPPPATRQPAVLGQPTIQILESMACEGCEALDGWAILGDLF